MLKETKTILGFTLLLTLTIIMLPGCSDCGKNNTAGNEENIHNQKLVDVVNNSYSCYDELIETVALGLKNGFTIEQMNNLPITTRFYNSFFNIGYARLDIDNNGVEELLFGEYGDDGFGEVVYDIYTISNGEILHTAFGWERNYYFLCGNGIVGNHGSNGAASNETAYFNYHGHMLWGEGVESEDFIESVIYDGWRDEANPWFHSTVEPWDENAEPISWNQANEILEGYKSQLIKFTPFT